MGDEEDAMEVASTIADICSQVQTRVALPTDDQDAAEATPNKAHVDKTVASLWRMRVRPFRIALMQYMNALESLSLIHI